MQSHPSVLVFDVNETLLDIGSLEPQFDRFFGDPGVLREWFAQLVLYSMTLTLSGRYVDFATLGRAVLRMTAQIRGIEIAEEAVQAFALAVRTMPAHPDVAPGLRRLRAAGYRLVTLTNSPTQPGHPTPLDHAGIASYVERQFSVDALRVYKPSAAVYRHVADELGVSPAECMLVAAHVWDTIGAQAVGFSGALLTRPGNAALPAPGVPAPDVTAADVGDLVLRLAAARGSCPQPGR